ncbi:hypothetical protein B0A49_01073 [Cryomyces minteri]|uniref:Uncharacterized protein n=1 Tax=Cryomyces minteri TaxID=331657 RepID=A0A4U0Y1D0_9PEZI|nr:hypothetical protein B0A49_01073 [Cryomyces minteri]
MPQRQQQRAMHSGVVNSNFAVPGSILWLPLKAIVKTSHLKRRKNDGAYAEFLSQLASIPNGAFNHPVVVIARSADTVDFHLITSFHGRTLGRRFTGNQERLCGYYLPIYPARSHPANHDPELGPPPKLRLVGGLGTERRDYVSVREIYSLDYADLELYDNPLNPPGLKYKLDHESLTALIVHNRAIDKQFKRMVLRAERAVPTPLAASPSTHPPRVNPIAAGNRIKPSENSSTLASCLTPATTDNRIRTSQIRSSLAKSLKPATRSNRTQTSPTPTVPARHHWYSGMYQATWNTTNDVMEGVLATDLTFRF